MKFKFILERINDVSIYPMISLFIFTAFFIGVLAYVFTVDTKKMNDQANIPLQ